MTIHLPARFRDKMLAGDPSGRLLGTVSTAVNEYSVWLSHSRTGMPFFPDYTDHGLGHLQEILQLIDFLIADGSNGTPDAWVVVTAMDVAALVLAVLAHDAGMYLDEAAFLHLIRNPAVVVPEVDTKAWGVVWEEFFMRARHWDGQVRARVFGAVLDQLPPMRREVRQPPDRSALWDEFDRRLVGEFVREHHARLAHEIALRGWPHSPSPDNGGAPPLCVAVNAPDLADLAGFVARSHGMPIRDALLHVETRLINPVEWRGTHPTYLMVLLRIADFLNLHAERAPTGITAIRKLASPVAKREWAAHAAIRDIRIDAERDPAALAIDVSPRDVPDMVTLNRLRHWATGLQRELDLSWAVLGELYGRHERLRALWLRVRRIGSSLYSDTFSKQLSFVPIDARLSADPDLASLLVQPLYGERPEIGVREMVQNAVDSVRERRDLLAHQTVSGLADVSEVIDPRARDADVVVSFATRSASTPSEAEGGPSSSWTAWLEVADRGVGMTEEVVRNFFLIAGASFRKSDAWRSTYEDRPAAFDEHRAIRSRVLRSGRFGIGVLAAFLLGDEMEVQTRHATKGEGLKFKVTLTTDSVPIVRICHRVGTTIRVRVPPTRVDDWHWQYHVKRWYRLVDPRVIYIDGTKVEAEEECVPPPGGDLPVAWHRVAVAGFLDVQWTYLHAPRLTCNGIVVEGVKPVWTHDADDDRGELPLAVPNVSVFDPDGRLPLDLARSRLRSDTYPFDAQLRESIIRDFLAYVLVHAPTRPFRGSAFPTLLRHRYPGYAPRADRGTAEAMPWVILPDGVTAPDRFLVQWAGVNRMLVVVRHYRARKIPGFVPQIGNAVFGFEAGDDRGWPLLDPYFCPTDGNPLRKMRILGARALVARPARKSLRQSSSQWDAAAMQRVVVEAETKTLVLWRTGETAPASLLHKLLKRDGPNAQALQMAHLIEWHIGAPERNAPPSQLSAAWRAIVGRPSVPFDQEERRDVLADAFRELAPEVAHWERLRGSTDQQSAIDSDWGMRWGTDY